CGRGPSVAPIDFSDRAPGDSGWFRARLAPVCGVRQEGHRTGEVGMPFHLDQFILDCLAARDADPSHKLVREVVARAVADPSGVLRALGEPRGSEAQRLYHAPNMTILHVILRPKITVMPPDHRMLTGVGR